MPVLHLSSRDLEVVQAALRALQDKASGATFGTPHQHEVVATLQKVERAYTNDKGMKNPKS